MSHIAGISVIVKTCYRLFVIIIFYKERITMTERGKFLVKMATQNTRSTIGKSNKNRPSVSRQIDFDQLPSPENDLSKKQTKTQQEIFQNNIIMKSNSVGEEIPNNCNVTTNLDNAIISITDYDINNVIANGLNYLEDTFSTSVLSPIAVEVKNSNTVEVSPKNETETTFHELINISQSSIEVVPFNNTDNVNLSFESSKSGFESMENHEIIVAKNYANIALLDTNNQLDGRNNANCPEKAQKRKIKKSVVSYKDYLSDADDFDLDTSSSENMSSDASDSIELEDPPRKKLKKNNKTLEEVVGERGLKQSIRTNKRKKRKELRNQGKEYIRKDGKVIPEKMMKPNPCLIKNCGRSCNTISDERRMGIFKHYHNLSSQRKRDWLLAMSQIEEIKRKRTKEQISRRKNTYLYFVNEGEGRRQVCLKFIIDTLDIQQRYVYYTLSNSSLNSSKDDKRGKHIPPNKTKEANIEAVRNYIKNLPAVPSHYCRKDSTKLYLPTEFKNINNLYRLYKEDFISNSKDCVGEKVFKNIFTSEFNLAFHIPKKDKCSKCMSFQNNPDGYTDEEIVQHYKERDDCKNRFKFHQEIHKQDKNTLCTSFDMQKVLNTPHGESMLLYYSRKYSVYNLTFYESTTREGICYKWGESDGKRGGNEIATILCKYVKKVDERKTVKNLLLYCDSCCGQNKNKTVLAALHVTLQSCQNIDTIQLNFLLPGHSYMPVDSVHSVIEKSIKGTIIYAPSQWSTVFTLARKNPRPYEVEVLTYKDFVGWDIVGEKYFKNNLKITKVKVATLKKKSKNCIYVKHTMSDEATTETIDCGNTKVKPTINLYKSCLPISEQKYKDLMKLCKNFTIPTWYHTEYQNLITNKNITDVLDESDVED